MAPSVPEEVDVFTVPHSRMKGLVSGYFDMLKSTNFSNDVDMDALLQNLLKTFMEFKTHEQIENRFIMKKLKNKLKRLSIQNTAVCNCHKDDQLGQMMRFIKDGYTKKTDQDRWNYGLRLKQELEDFTENFLPHMQEEEEPLLLKYFTYEELCQLKEKVIQQHIIQEQIRAAGLLEKQLAQDLTSFSSSSEEEVEKCTSQEEEEGTSIGVLPDEVLGTVFGFLSAQDLGRAAQVCRRWNQAAYEPVLWRNILPVQWAEGDWSFEDKRLPGDDEVDAGFMEEEEEGYIVIDDDADVDESEVADDDVDAYNEVISKIQREGRVLSGLARHVLPRVGSGVHRLSLANSRAITNGMLNRLIQHCPNLEYLDLTQTRVGDAGLKSLGKRGFGQKLKSLIFSGCGGISDATMVRLSMAINSANNQPSTSNFQDGCPQNQDCCQKNQTQDGCNENQDCCQGSQIQDGYPSNGIQDGCSNQYQDGRHNKAVDKNRRVEDQCLCEEYYRTYNVVLEKGCHVTESWNNQRCGEYRQDQHPVDEEKDGQSEKSLMSKATVEANRPEVVKDFSMKNVGIDVQAAAIPNCDNERKISQTNCCKNEGKSTVIKTSGGQGSRGQGQNSNPPDSVDNTLVDKNGCHAGCVPLKSWGSIEDCAGVAEVHRSPRNERPEKRSVVVGHNHTLQYLDLSGCYQVTDMGLSALSSSSLSFSRLAHVDVSGCVRVTGAGLARLVARCPALAPADLYYCDNVSDGPFPDAASGCRNVDCGNRRVCCRAAEIM